jgi:[ribosomal protein S18]-alanine N-acetyltransferase
VSRQLTPIPPAAPLALAAMHRACFPDDPWDAAAIGRILALPGAFGYVGWDGEVPAGFVLACDLGDEAEILSLGVLPQCRRRGVAGALAEAVFAEARRRHLASVVLEVAVGNEAARRLYAKLGFVQVGRRPRYYRLRSGVCDALILRRDSAGDAAPR